MRVLQLGTVAAVPWSVRLMIPGVAWSLSRWILFGVRGRGFVIKDSGTVAAVLSMIQAVNGCGGAVVDSVGGSLVALPSSWGTFAGFPLVAGE